MTPLAPSELTTRPRISVVIPCYNYGHFLEGAVASALAHDGVDVDVLVVDDASTDDSAVVAQRIAEADPRVDVLLHEQNRGHIRTYNDGLAKVTGDYVVLLSADDLLTPNALTRAAALLESCPGVGFVYGPTLLFDDVPPAALVESPRWIVREGRAWAGRVFAAGRNVIRSPEVVMRASVMDAIGLYDPEHPHAGDLQMWLRAAAVADVGYLAGTTQAFYRQHGENMHSTVFGTDHARGMLTELTHRHRALLTSAASFADWEAETRSACRALAVEALDLASRAYVWGLTESWPVAELMGFARECDPSADETVAGRALRRRVRAGRRLSRRNPAFVLRERLLDRHESMAQRRIVETGLP